jgi:uncharacterized membrane protein
MRTQTLPFDRKDALTRGWNLALAHLGLVATVVAIGWLVSAVEASLRRPGAASGASAALLLLALQAVHLVVTMGGLAIFLRLYDGQPTRLGDLFEPLPLFFRFLFAQLLYGLIVAAGLLLLVVPGVIWAIRYGFVPFLVIDKQLDPFAALRASKRLTSGHTRALFGFGLLLFGVNLLGALALGVGLLVTIPATAMAAAHAYRSLVAAAEHDTPAPAANPPLFGRSPT